MNLIVRPGANGDLRDALVWFILRRHYALARTLNLAWLAALEAIEAMPRRFSPVEDAPEGYEVRECYIARFKYRVIFYISGNDIRVIALIHARQHDRLWMSRLTAE
jgi:plasmid stabilization system protein ParE